jgi:hypothetical protein
MLLILLGSIALTGTGFYISAQQAPYNRLVHVIVTEPANRIVTGLAQENFEVIENGVVRPVTFFDRDSRVSIALVGVSAAGVARLNRPEDDLIQAQSVADAVQQLAASKNIRKALIVVGAGATAAVPDGIEVLNSDETNLPRTVLEVYTEYVLGFSSSGRISTIEVTLKPPEGLPPLKLAQR